MVRKLRGLQIDGNRELFTKDQQVVNWGSRYSPPVKSFENYEFSSVNAILEHPGVRLLVAEQGRDVVIGWVRDELDETRKRLSDGESNGDRAAILEEIVERLAGCARRCLGPVVGDPGDSSRAGARGREASLVPCACICARVAAASDGEPRSATARGAGTYRSSQDPTGRSTWLFCGGSPVLIAEGVRERGDVPGRLATDQCALRRRIR